MSTITIYSAKINAGEGHSSPSQLADIPGWTVFKMHTTEVYEITHNLNLSDPERDLHIVATSMNSDATVVIGNLKSNSFIVNTWAPDTAPIQADFMFIAKHNQ